MGVLPVIRGRLGGTADLCDPRWTQQLLDSSDYIVFSGSVWHCLEPRGLTMRHRLSTVPSSAEAPETVSSLRAPIRRPACRLARRRAAHPTRHHLTLDNSGGDWACIAWYALTGEMLDP
jgi:hypothetical protein